MSTVAGGPFTGRATQQLRGLAGTRRSAGAGDGQRGVRRLQTALLEHAAAHNLRTVMTFHQRVEEAQAFAEKLPESAAGL